MVAGNIIIENSLMRVRDCSKWPPCSLPLLRFYVSLSEMAEISTAKKNPQVI